MSQQRPSVTSQQGLRDGKQYMYKAKIMDHGIKQFTMARTCKIACPYPRCNQIHKYILHMEEKRNEAGYFYADLCIVWSTSSCEVKKMR